jgi:hypothetical protein
MNRLQSAASSSSSLPARILKKKSVSFSDMCRVVLIPMRQEYSAAGINLWWSRKDFSKFRQGYATDRKRALHAAHISKADSAEDEKVDPILIVSNSPAACAALTVKLSSIATNLPTFVTCSHSDISEAFHSGSSFSAVILDGTTMDASDNDDDSLSFVNSIHTIRNMKGSGIKMTVFVDNDAMASSHVKDLISETSVESSDIVFLTPDCWAEFRGLIENAGLIESAEIGMG